MPMLPGNVFHFPSTVCHDMFIISAFNVSFFFHKRVTSIYNFYCSQNISKIPILSLSGRHFSLAQSIPEIQLQMCFYTMLSL